MSSLVSFESIRALLGHAPVILFAVDQTGKITFAEGGALATLDQPANGHPTRSRVGQQVDAQDALDAIQRALAGEPVNITLTRNDHTFDVHYLPVRAATGAITGVIGLGIDVTERDNAERAYHDLFDEALDGRFQLNTDGKAELINPALAQILGYASVDELLNTDPYFGLIPFAKPAQRQEIRTLLEQERQLIRFPFEAQRRDGQQIWLEISAKVFYDHQQQPLGITGHIEDITARVLAERQLAESEERFRLLVEGVSDLAVFMLDPTGHIVSWNSGATRLNGYPAEEVIGQPLSRFYTPADQRAGVPQQLLAQAAQAGRVEEEGWRVRRDGSHFWANSILNALYGPDGSLRGFARITRDRTDQWQAETALAASEERFRSTFENAAIGMAIVNPAGQFVRVNQALCKLVGYAAAELLQLDFQTITHPDDLDSDLSQVQALLDNQITSYAMEKRYLRHDGSSVWVQLDVSLVRDAEGTPLHFLSQIQDIDARKAAEAQLRHQALHDALTGLPNRALFLDRLVGALARRQRRDEWLGVAFVDLDGFKEVNDQFGHAAGDALLAIIAERLRLRIRASDTVARYGGDEFTILLDGNINQHDAETLMSRIIAATETPVAFEGHLLTVSASIGLALSPPTDNDAGAILAEADAAMYAAKLAGKGRWILANRQTATQAAFAALPPTS